MNAALGTPPPDFAPRNGVSRSATKANPPMSTTPSTTLSYTDLDNMVYPIGQTQGIDPMYSEHVHKIPYPMPQRPPEGAPPMQVAQAARKKSTQIDPGWIRPPQVLLVEDDPTCRRIGGKFLVAFQCQLDSAVDGLEAVNKLNAGSRYDLILMDIIMPTLDGVSATHLIRQTDTTIPIIAMTSNIRSDDISLYFNHGMNDVLPKPFTKEGLLSMLDKHLSHLKKHHGGGLDPMGPPFNSNPVKRIAKGEDSPGASSANNSNWNSPGMAGTSPANNNMNDDPFLNPASGGGYNASGLPTSVPPHMFAPAPQVQLSMPQRAQQQQQQQLPPQQHRRNISDISGGQMDMNDPKRQQMYAPGQPMPQMLQRPQQ